MFRNHLFRFSTATLVGTVCSAFACNVTLPPLGDLLDDLDPIITPDPNPPDSNAPQTTGRQALFDELWQTFDDNYSYFEYKGIDWNDVRARHRPDFAADLSDDEFTDRIVEMLAELHDFHVEVMYPDGTWVGTDPQHVELNYTSAPRNRYTLNDSGYQTLGNNVIWHAWYADSIAYIRIDTFSTSAFEGISQAEVDDLFFQYNVASAMIVDIRPNNGGNENIAMEFASHFTSAELVYGYTEIRNGPEHWEFDPIETKSLEPCTQNRFDGPVACLVGQRCLSSAEWFTLMMRACPNVTLIGDTTRGGSGFPREFELDNGVHYTVPRWIAYTDELIEFEDVGIDPDIWIPADESSDASYDYVVEMAISWLGP